MSSSDTPPAPSARLPDGRELQDLARYSGEHRLMLAILADAIALCTRPLSGSIVPAREARAARAWFASRDRSLPFAFEYVCDVLGFDSGYIRRGVWGSRLEPAAARPARCNNGRGTGSAAPRRAAPHVGPPIIVIGDAPAKSSETRHIVVDADLPLAPLRAGASCGPR